MSLGAAGARSLKEFPYISPGAAGALPPVISKNSLHSKPGLNKVAQIKNARRDQAGTPGQLLYETDKDFLSITEKPGVIFYWRGEDFSRLVLRQFW